MGLLDRIRDRHDQLVHNAYPVPSSADVWGSEYGHRDGFSPTEYGDYLATSNDIYSLVTFRARLMGALDMRAYVGRDANKQGATSGAVVDLLRKVNPFWTFSRLMRMTETCMGLWGEAYWVVNRGPSGLGRPQELWWVKPTRMHPVPDANEYVSGFLYDPPGGGEPVAFRASEVIWFRYPNPLDEFAGISPLAAARLAADTSSAMMKSNRNLFVNGLQSAGILAPPKGVTFSPEQALTLQEKLEERLRGVDKAHRIAVLRFEAQMSQVSVTPKDAEFIAGLNMTFRQAAKAYGVPTPLMGDMEHATLANVRELQRALWEHALMPDAKFYTDDLEEQLLPMFQGNGRGRSSEPDHIAFDFSGIPALQEATTAVWTRERQQIAEGALTINEWRASKGMPDVPWGDVAWMAVNRAPVSDADDRPADDYLGQDPDDDRPSNRLRVDGAAAEALLASLELPSMNGHRN